MDIDETRGDLEVTPTVVTDDAEIPVVVLGFFGTNAHGVLYLRPGDPHPSSPSEWPFRIAPLTGTAPPAMQDLVIGNTSVTVPAADADRFASAYYPRLTRAATVRSVDDAFTPPTVDGPHLLLTVSYLSGHRAQLHWEFRYTVGEAEQTVELYPRTLESFRDVDGERAVVAGLDLPLEEYGLRTGGGALVSAGLHGLDTARMSTELLRSCVPVTASRSASRATPPTTATPARPCRSASAPRQPTTATVRPRHHRPRRGPAGAVPGPVRRVDRRREPPAAA